MIELPTKENPVAVHCRETLGALIDLPDAVFDMVCTDPPYSSGGMTRGDRMQSVADKYVQTGTERFRLSDFDGDNRDSFGWQYWSALWLNQALRVTRPGGFCLMFCDWRQLANAITAFQSGGWVHRGVISWDKGPSARSANTSYFRHQCEYVIWGTRGPGDGYAGTRGPWPGSYTVPVVQDDKHHITGKPTKLMRLLLEPVEPGGLVLDPFGGSGTTAVACAQTNRRCVVIEQHQHYCDLTRTRVDKALCRDKNNLFQAEEIGQ